MTPKEKRDKLFRRNRPFLRPLEITDGEDYSQDLKTLYVAHTHKPFLGLPEMEASAFMETIEEWANAVEFMVAEDVNNAFNDKGVVALITMATDGWKLEPHVEFMPWATPRNILGIVVAFFQMIRYSHKVGVCVVHARDEKLFPHVQKFFPPGFLRKVGKIPFGFPEGDDFIYSMRGRK